MGPRLSIKELAAAFLVIVVFSLLATHYFSRGALPVYLEKITRVTQEKIGNGLYAQTCPPEYVQRQVEGGTICRPPADNSWWLHIYDTYPHSGGGKEIMYPQLDEGDLKIANRYLQDYHPVSRYQETHIPAPITWTEDPYQERYWRFIFYSLRETRHLLFAARTTGDERYFNKLQEILDSFLTHGVTQPSSWNDSHGVAYRTMVLVNTWWKLREQNRLTSDLNEKMLVSLRRHGEFLVDPIHYEPGNNHSVAQATALYVLATNFPEMPGASQWHQVAQSRITQDLPKLIDADGALIENSPHYHFYVLRHFWSISEYLKKYGAATEQQLSTVVDRMIEYATYMLQPNLETPQLGASLKRSVRLTGEYEVLAHQNPRFLYVLTQGKEGEQPPDASILFPSTGQAILRSEWGTRSAFTEATQLIFDVGDYRTDHSDLDALSFHLYGARQQLMPDVGLYTYEEGPYRHYFHGTRAHNTVVVDGLDQPPGAAEIGFFERTEHGTYQSALHTLYSGVTHQRAVALLDSSLVVIVDSLNSAEPHRYEQMFHLFPNARVSQQGTTVRAVGPSSKQTISIHQLLPAGLIVSRALDQHNPPAGLCSYEYEEYLPCEEISYQTTAAATRFITLLEIGAPDPTLNAQVSSDNQTVMISRGGDTYTIAIDQRLPLASADTTRGPLVTAANEIKNVRPQLHLDLKKSSVNSTSFPEQQLFALGISSIGLGLTLLILWGGRARIRRLRRDNLHL